MIPKEGLDNGTRSGYDARDMDTQDETWAGIPDLDGYEVSTSGRIRKWVTVKGKVRSRIYEGRKRDGEIIYDLAGNPYTLDDLMCLTFGEDALDDFVLGHEPGERDRDLSSYEVSEITLSEGYKPAHEVAAEFRIDSSRVRGIWDGE